MEEGKVEDIVNLRFTHKEIPITDLKKVTFKENCKTLKEIHSLDLVKECVILQTCNRVEVYARVSAQDLTKAKLELAEHWRQKTDIKKERFYQVLRISLNSQALSHLMKLTSGLESMVVGEDQILGQVQKGFEEAKKCGTVGSFLSTTFSKAIKVGKKVRLKTKINKGSVSIGSAAVKLLEESFGDLKDKKIIIIGAGETGGLVGKALASRSYAVIFVANRTFERGFRLAKMLGGKAVRFNKFKKLLTKVDAVVVATAAPHYILTRKLLQEILEKRNRKQLFIIDLSQPRNVEESVASLSYVKLRTIDDLRGIAETNLRKRHREIEKAKAIVEKELQHLDSMLKQEQAEPIISALLHKAEEVRQKEIKHAMRLIGELTANQQKVIDDLTFILIERILHYPIKNLRKAAANGDENIISVVQKLFNLNLSLETN